MIGVPFFLFLLYLVKIPESVRWLLTKGRRGDAREVIRSIASFNNVILPDLDVDDEEEERTQPIGISCLFFNPVLR